MQDDLLYIKDVAIGPLWKVLAEGGEETQVLDSVYSQSFEVASNGIYFIARSRLYYFDFATQAVEPILPIERLN